MIEIKEESKEPFESRWYRVQKKERNTSNPEYQESGRHHLAVVELENQSMDFLDKPPMYRQRLSRSKPREIYMNSMAIDLKEQEVDDPNVFLINQSLNHLLLDDILIQIKHKGTFGSAVICRFGFNTSFIEDECVHFPIKELEPIKIGKDTKYDENFIISVSTEIICRKGDPKLDAEQLGIHGKDNMEKEVKRWIKIKEIIFNTNKKYGAQLKHKDAAEMHFIHSSKYDYLTVLR